MVLASQDSWDRYAAAQWLNIRRWLDANPGDVLERGKVGKQVVDESALAVGEIAQRGRLAEDIFEDLQANRRPTGSAPYYKLEQANVILSLDCDFIGTEADAHRHIRGFARKRKVEKPDSVMNRLYSVEGLMTLTGMNADHRLRVPAGQVVEFGTEIEI